MRKNATKIAALALSLALTATSVNVPTNASAATVKLNKTKATLYASGATTKKTTTLKVTGTKSKVTFTSSNKKVATVKSKGRYTATVTAKKKGTAKITAKVGKKSYKCTITVQAKYTPVKSLAVSPKTVSMEAGTTKNFTATVKPANPTQKGVTVKSSNEKIATVKSVKTVTSKTARKTTFKITAKKKGTAKITVTTKGAMAKAKNKTATVAVTVTKATTATTAPSDAPSTAPTDEPSTAPTDEPSAAPATTLGKIVEAKAIAVNKIAVTFDSTVPDDTKLDVTYLGGDVTGTIAITGSSIVFTAANSQLVEGEYQVVARLGEEKTEPVSVTVKERVVSDIKIKGEKALTASDTENKKYYAYVYYEVVDQYGEECGDLVNLTWSGGPGEVTWDASKSKITVTKEDSYFVPGSTISLTAVSIGTKDAFSKSFTVEVGQEQQLDSVDIKGFMDLNNKGTVLDDLPANFAKDRYVLLYTVKDQNKNDLDVTAEENGDLPMKGGKVTFISTTPMVVESTISDSDIVTDKDGKDYFAAKLTPGMYADKGGNFTIKYIANRTGNQDEKTFTLGTNGYLTKLELKQPSSYITDGETVELDYVATIENTEGKTTTKDYETIVRSSNTLNLSASVGTLRVYEKDNGDAGIEWIDDRSANDFSDHSASDGQDRPVTLTTVVVGGEASTLPLSVKDTRRPAAIKSVSLANGDDNIMVESNTDVKVNFDGIVFVDQYGQEFTKDTIKNALAFFKQASTGEGFNKEYYAIRANVDQSPMVLGKALPSQYVTNFASVELDPKEAKVLTDLNFNPQCDIKDGNKIVTSDIIKYSIVKDSKPTADWVAAEYKTLKTVGKELTVEYTIVPQAIAIPSASIKDIKLQQVDTQNNDPNGKKYFGDDPEPLVIDSIKNGETVTLVSKYNGKSFVLPKNAGTIAYEHTTVADAAIASGSAIEVNADGKLINVIDGKLEARDLYVNDGYSYPRQNAALTLELKVTSDSVTNAAIVAKEVTVSDAPSYLAKIEVEDIEASPRNTIIGDTWTVREGESDVPKSNPLFATPIKGYDQYGNDYTDFSYKATVTLTEEADTLRQHLDKSFIVEDNGTAKVPKITGAEIGDTFKLTIVATDGTSKNIKVTSESDLTVKADTSAYISDKASEQDKTFRTGPLKMYR